MYSSTELQNSLAIVRSLGSARIASRSRAIADCRALSCCDRRYSLIRISAKGSRLTLGSLAKWRNTSINSRSSITHLPAAWHLLPPIVWGIIIHEQVEADMSEDDCIICGKWPANDRWAVREMIEALPLQDDRICDECLRAFAVQLFGGAKPKAPTKR